MRRNPGCAAASVQAQGTRMWMASALWEIRQRQSFAASVEDIRACLTRGSTIAAKRRLKKLMAKLTCVPDYSGNVIQLISSPGPPTLCTIPMLNAHVGFG